MPFKSTHSQSYSNYKSRTTFKSLIGVDPLGGVLFLSQLNEGSISDKEIVKRSGLLDVLEKRLKLEKSRRKIPSWLLTRRLTLRKIYKH